MSYENTLYFASESAKNSYFNRLTNVTAISAQSYQRLGRSYCRVQVAISVLYNVDYMSFTNQSFEDKYFYAFVTGINYINNVTTEVEYVLDPLMTWMGNFGFKQCFIERQHTLYDEIGGNITEEGLSTGSYIDEAINSTDDYGESNSMIRIVVANPNESQAHLFGGIYNGCKYVDKTSAEDAANYINSLVADDLESNIVTMFMVPAKFANVGQIATEIYRFDKPYNDVGGYVPRNKKLFCYPYKYLVADNSEGSQQEYKYEYFNSVPDSASSGQYRFIVAGISANDVQIKLTPVAYNGTEQYTNEYALGMSHFPQCAWLIDTYEAYLAQKNAYYVHDLANAGAQGFLSGLTGRIPAAYAGMGAKAPTTISTGTSLVPAGTSSVSMPSTVQVGGSAGLSSGAASLINGAISGLTDMASVTADRLVDNIIRPEAGTQMRGSLDTDLTFSQAQKKFFFHEKTITAEYARRIDNYFSMYGYKIGEIGAPNMNARPHWTYVKTTGCDLTGSIPASDKSAIETIFDSGVRFWHNLDEMGNYGLDNSPNV